MVLNGAGGFEVVSTDGDRIAQADMDGKAVAVPSPDGRRIAYVASDPAGELAVYVLDLDNGVSESLGPTGKTALPVRANLLQQVCLSVWATRGK